MHKLLAEPYPVLIKINRKMKGCKNSNFTEKIYLFLKGLCKGLETSKKSPALYKIKMRNFYPSFAPFLPFWILIRVR
jgi:hypothetical protein